MKNKKFIFSILFTAWSIIFAHSIIPHHHHDKNNIIECDHCLNHSHISQGIEFHDCDHDFEHTCHFHVDILTQISIDHVFIINTEDNFFNTQFISETNCIIQNEKFVSDKIPKSNYLRGPPCLS